MCTKFAQNINTQKIPDDIQEILKHQNPPKAKCQSLTQIKYFFIMNMKEHNKICFFEKIYLVLSELPYHSYIPS